MSNSELRDGDIRISDLAHEINIKTGRIAKRLTAWGIGKKVKPTMWLRASLADKIRAYYQASVGTMPTVSPLKRLMVKFPHCPKVMREERLAAHLDTCTERLHPPDKRPPQGFGSDLTAVPLAAHGSLSQLIELAAKKGIPETLVREQLRKKGTSIDELRVMLERLPQVERPGFSSNAVSAFREGLEITRLPFRLLPPGKWDVERVIHSYREVNKASSAWGGPNLDLERLAALVSLGPTRCYVGTELWSWYVLFEFDEFNAGVLECPYEGNATYIIRGPWKNVVSHTKRELREEFAERCTKIVHKNDWLQRIRLALRSAPVNKRI